MAQLTLRIPDQLLAPLRSAASTSGKSVNAWATAVLSAAVDPDLAGDEAEALRARLRRAGLLVPNGGRTARRPPADQAARARVAAGRGRSLVELVDEGRH
jgi:plasmid stability protein